MSFLLVQQASALDWPDLDSEKSPVHKRIINSILTKDTGGQFHDQWFKSKGQGIPVGQNQALANNLQDLTSALQAGQKVELRPTSSPDVYSHFTKNCKYQILVDGQKKSEFILYNAAALQGSNPQTPLRGLRRFRGEDAVALQNELQNRHILHRNVSHPRVDEPVSIFSGINPVHIGHGARPIHQEANAVSDDVISQLMAQHGNKAMLNEAFKIIEGADVAQVNDRKILAKHISNHQHIDVSRNIFRETSIC